MWLCRPCACRRFNESSGSITKFDKATTKNVHECDGCYEEKPCAHFG